MSTFDERLVLAPVLQWVIRAGAVVLAGITLFAVVTEDLQVWERVLGAVLGLGVAALLLVVHGRVRLTADDLHLALVPFWRTRLALREVATLRKTTVDPLLTMHRFGLGHVDDSLLLAMRKGGAVRVGMRDGRSYTVGLRRPADLVAAVREVRPDL